MATGLERIPADYEGLPGNSYRLVWANGAEHGCYSTFDYLFRLHGWGGRDEWIEDICGRVIVQRKDGKRIWFPEGAMSYTPYSGSSGPCYVEETGMRGACF